MQTSSVLSFIRLAHTVAWAFFAGCIVLLPLAAHAKRFDIAIYLVGFVLLEVLILAVNQWRCPLTGIAARYTADRKANFDIFLPLWLARYNKEVFGTLFMVGLAYTAFKWWHHAGGT